MDISRIERMSYDAIECSEKLELLLGELLSIAQDKNLLETQRQLVGIEKSIRSLDSANVPVPDELQLRLIDLRQKVGGLEKVEYTLKKIVEKLPALSPGLKRIIRPSISSRKGKEDENSETLIGQVFQIIESRKNGISKQELGELVNHEGRQLSNALYKLTRRGKIKSISRGFYTIDRTEFTSFE